MYKNKKKILCICYIYDDKSNITFQNFARYLFFNNIDDTTISAPYAYSG